MDGGILSLRDLGALLKGSAGSTRKLRDVGSGVALMTILFTLRCVMNQ